jgi:hypothetical protein
MKWMAAVLLTLAIGNLWWLNAQEPAPQERRIPPEVERMREEMLRNVPPEFRELLEQQFEDFFDEGLSDRPQSGAPLPESPFSGPRFGGMREEANRELRNRRIDRNEKLAARNLTAFAPVVKSYESSVVTMLNGDGKALAFATCVSKEGLFITKASEVVNREDLKAKRRSTVWEAEVLDVNERFDLALIRLQADDFSPVTWQPGHPDIGTLLVSCDEAGRPLATGVVSVEPRPLTDQDRAFLGVEPVTVDGGVLVNSVSEGYAAAEAGLQAGDVVISMDGKPTTTNHQFANDIRLKRPGDEVDLVIRRGDSEISVTVKLKSLNVSPFARLGGEMGAQLNSRMSDFDLAFQHDTPLWPEQCGGPLVDLDGQVVGFNIARSGRVRSYAIPSGKMAELVEQMIESIEAETP